MYIKKSRVGVSWWCNHAIFFWRFKKSDIKIEVAMMDPRSMQHTACYIDIAKAKKGLVASYEFIPTTDYISSGLLTQIKPILTAISGLECNSSIDSIDGCLVSMGCERLWIER